MLILLSIGLIIPLSAKANSSAGYRLDRLWPISGESSGIVAHKQNYLLFTYTDEPNYIPSTPTRVSIVPPYYYDNQEVKFQFSLKTQYPHRDFLGLNNSIWLGYTQQSHMQFANKDNSRPFRAHNYIFEPFIFSHQFEKWQPLGYWNPRFLNFGFVHDSNGETQPYSRSWNRLYLQFGSEKRISNFRSIAVVLRPWTRYPINTTFGGDNPDIVEYMGKGDIEVLFWQGKHLLSALARSRALQFGWSIPLTRGSSSAEALHLHFHFFTGYGESLIDYNQKHSTIGIGFSLPYDVKSNGKCAYSC